jgi:DNA-binding GntR family transcriptional regulator
MMPKRKDHPGRLSGGKASVSPIQVEIQEASDEVAAGLWIAEGTKVISRPERRFIDGTPWSTQTSFYPMEFADRGAERLGSSRNIDEGTVRYLSETLHIHQVGYRDSITVRAPNATEADFFKLPWTAAPRFSKYSGRPLTETGDPCGSPSPYIRRIGTSLSSVAIQ